MQNAATGEMEQVEDKQLAQELKADGHCVICPGETLQIQGGTFRVKSVGKKMMILEGLPKTRIKEVDPKAEIARAVDYANKFRDQRNNYYAMLVAVIQTLGGQHLVPAAVLDAVNGSQQLNVQLDEQTKMLTVTVAEQPAKLPQV